MNINQKEFDLQLIKGLMKEIQLRGLVNCEMIQNPITGIITIRAYIFVAKKNKPII